MRRLLAALRRWWNRPERLRDLDTPSPGDPGWLNRK